MKLLKKKARKASYAPPVIVLAPRHQAMRWARLHNIEASRVRQLSEHPREWRGYSRVYIVRSVGGASYSLTLDQRDAVAFYEATGCVIDAHPAPSGHKMTRAHVARHEARDVRGPRGVAARAIADVQVWAAGVRG